MEKYHLPSSPSIWPINYELETNQIVIQNSGKVHKDKNQKKIEIEGSQSINQDPNVETTPIIELKKDSWILKKKEIPRWKKKIKNKKITIYIWIVWYGNN